MEMIELGYSFEDGMKEPACQPESKVYYPEFHVEGMKKNIGKDVGEEFYAKVKLCKTSIRKDKNGKFSCSYEVKAIGSIKEKSDAEKEFGELLEEAAEMED